jgi:hypothetical protein
LIGIIEINSNITPLRVGEWAPEKAPIANLANGLKCIPQHYLTYCHSLASIEALVLKIEFDVLYPVFVSRDDSSIYIQVAVIGNNNYETKSNDSTAKIVYGRKWRVEPNLASSEVIQTVFLALKKAREHEIREQFRLTALGKSTTPFNNHHDLPLLAYSQAALKNKSNEPATKTEIETELASIEYDHTTFTLDEVSQRPSGHWLVELSLNVSKKIKLSELNTPTKLILILKQLTLNLLLCQLMQELINLSDRQVDEKFTYDGFSRFSWNNNIRGIASISSETRQLHNSMALDSFSKQWRQNNYEIDLTRVPKLFSSPLGQKLKTLLEANSPLSGILPTQLTTGLPVQ